jgi:hypothetical protein
MTSIIKNSKGDTRIRAKRRDKDMPYWFWGGGTDSTDRAGGKTLIFSPSLLIS